MELTKIAKFLLVAQAGKIQQINSLDDIDGEDIITRDESDEDGSDADRRDEDRRDEDGEQQIDKIDSLLPSISKPRCVLYNHSIHLVHNYSKKIYIINSSCLITCVLLSMCCH